MLETLAVVVPSSTMLRVPKMDHCNLARLCILFQRLSKKGREPLLASFQSANMRAGGSGTSIKGPKDFAPTLSAVAKSELPKGPKCTTTKKRKSH